MGDICLLAASVLAQTTAKPTPPPPTADQVASPSPRDRDCQTPATPDQSTQPESHTPEFSLSQQTFASVPAVPASVQPDAYATALMRPQPIRPPDDALSLLPEPAPDALLPISRSRPQPTQTSLNYRVDPSPHHRLSPSSPSLPHSPTPIAAAPTLYPPPATLITPRPASGSQLYQQRWAALRAGRLYTRLPANSFYEAWVNAQQQPTHEQWIHLLAQEAQVMAQSQGNNRLTVLLGDSLSLWFPPERLQRDRFFLNQGISGDTTAGVLRRLPALARTRPDTIHVMVGINDLRRGDPDEVVLARLQQIMRQLRQQHPQARVVVHSILPTRLPTLPGHRIRRFNQTLAAIAQQERVQYLDLQGYFADAEGNLRPDLTTDGLHLNPQGYAMWQLAIGG